MLILIRDAEDEDENKGCVVTREDGMGYDLHVSEAIDWDARNLVLDSAARHREAFTQDRPGTSRLNMKDFCAKAFALL